MKINWDSIKYIFQIPIKWFESISNRVFNAYGSNFIVVKEGYYGGTEIGINDDAFANQVESHLQGVVKSVDNISPDTNGNVALNAVKTVNEIQPDENGNVELDVVETVNNLSPDENGNVDVGTVKFVNSLPPDANGNVIVAIPADTYTKEEINTKLKDYVTLNTSQDITGEKRFSANKLVLKTPGNAGDAGNYGNFNIKSLDGELMARIIGGSSNGNNHTCYMRGYVGSHYSGINCTTNGVDDNQNLENEPIADTTLSTSPQIASRGWTNKNFIRSNTTSQGLIYSDHGTISYVDDYLTSEDLEAYYTSADVDDLLSDALDSYYTKTQIDDSYYTKTQADAKYVTLATTQTITGAKTFTSPIKTVANFNHAVNRYQYQWYDTLDGVHLGCLIYGGNDAGAHSMTLRAYDANGNSGIQCIQNGDTHQQILNNEPDRLYSVGVPEQIASRGYCRSNFAKTIHDHGYITYDGKITHNYSSPNFNSDYVLISSGTDGKIGRVTLSSIMPGSSGNPITTSMITDWDSSTANFATKSSVEECENGIEAINDALVDYVQQSDLANYVQQSDLTNYVQQSDLTDYVQESDLTDYVKKPSGTSLQSLTNQTIVTNVTWNGTQIVIEKMNLTFSNGLLVGKTNPITQTINTVAYSES